jgi:hypothetical protein
MTDEEEPFVTKSGKAFSDEDIEVLSIHACWGGQRSEPDGECSTDVSEHLRPEANPAIRRAVVGFLCSSALADDLGDVRAAEDKLWDLLGAKKLTFDDDYDADSAWFITQARLKKNNLDIPAYWRRLHD